MGCASSREASGEPIKQISGPIAVVKQTPTFKAVQHEHADVTADSARAAAGSVRSSPEASGSDDTVSIHTKEYAGQDAGVKKPLSAPLTVEITPAGEDVTAVRDPRKGYSGLLPGGELPPLQTPPTGRPLRRPTRSLSLEPTKASQLEGDALRAAIERPSGALFSAMPPSLAVGKCGTVSFSNPLKGELAGNRITFENPQARRTSLSGNEGSPRVSAKTQSYVASWLAALNLSQYAAAFELAGYDESDTLANLSPADLTQIETFAGISILPGHKKRLVLASARPVSANQSAPVSPYLTRTPEAARLMSRSPDTDTCGELDTLSSRATESLTSSPASVLPTLVLPRSLLEARKGGHLARTHLPEGSPAHPSFEGEDRRSSWGGAQESGLRGGGSGEHVLVEGERFKRGPQRRTLRNARRSPRHIIRLKAGGPWGADSASETEGVKGRGLTFQNVAAMEGSPMSVERRAELRQLKAQLQAKVEELRLAQTKDNYAALSPQPLTSSAESRLQKLDSAIRRQDPAQVAATTT
ncbi:hypothetical protein KFL_000960070 [Klebsormidium nitens]|uniref:SAM domain-containing protein n=1 Tax=Klebsormidium nitens TaxID=105231 RepID=A0A0U9HRR5_KLENI|nr:hypothetical protein KFL_000960070 [Klebsormidium nitens]|eukprot:GAQ81956.1 hypothetical protein KFL_000960070 [Klebsormidium nitens]